MECLICFGLPVGFLCLVIFRADTDAYADGTGVG